MGKDDENYKNKRKVKDHCHYTGKFRGAAHSKCNLNYKIPKDIPIGKLNCIGENMEKYMTFYVPVKKECENGKKIAYKLSFIDRF